jgi:membrane peptidoglycan carboxypeptidase
MELGPPCEERKILAEPGLAVPILSGMEQVVLAGTARGLEKPPGVRIYGKTGTADAIGTKDEIVFGVPYNEWGPPNSWFLGIAEDENAEPDQAHTSHRIVTAVVVPRGGLGARVSGPAAMEILTAVHSLGYITPKAEGPPGAQAAPGAPTGSPAPGAPGGKAPITVMSPVLATPPPSVRPPVAVSPGAPAPGASPAGAAPAGVAPPGTTPHPSAPPAARPSSAVSPPATHPAASPPAGAPVSPAPAVSPRPAPPATTPRPPTATPTPRPSPPAAAPSPSPPAQVP